MASPKKESFFVAFLKPNNVSPLLAAIAAGLYPIFFYYSNNYPLVNTWGHFGYFLSMFIGVPFVVFIFAKLIQKKIVPEKFKKYIFPFLNIFIFLFLMKVCLYAGIQKKMIVVIFFIAIVAAYLLHKHLKKIIALQLILAIIAGFSLTQHIVKQLTYDTSWMQQPDEIASATFKKKPNIYYIQPDGYVNFSTLRKAPYNYDNTKFENFVAANSFVHYPNFRSNYAATLSSNSSTFMMKHHYYNGEKSFNEALNARDIIMSKNTVLDVFKGNGYNTTFLGEKHYLLMNKPTMGYDNSNIIVSEIPFIGTGLGKQRNVVQVLDSIKVNNAKPQFFFIEMFNPGHIEGRESISDGSKIEREEWLESLKKANENLTQLITVVKKKDPNALIIIMADHGGFVGMDFTEQIYKKTQDAGVINSIFSSNLLIHWPNNEAPSYDENLVSSVNLFRILFSYLSENEQYLTNLEDNSSYVILNEGVPNDVYKYIDDAGDITLEKVFKN